MKYLKLIRVYIGATILTIGLLMVFGAEGSGKILDIVLKEYKKQLAYLRAKSYFGV